jgi:alanine-glyoxylate transaminase / serine-glyoxylate transaminase / serine-pyruvate transaminase
MHSQNPVSIPGPTNARERLRCATDLPTVDHRSQAVAGLLKPVLGGVRFVRNTRDAAVVLFPATATAGWEAAITDTLCPGDGVLAARHGAACSRIAGSNSADETGWR